MNSQKTDNQKRFFIHTLGCKVNQYESQAMRELLAKAGFMECLSRDIADIYIINTCTVTDKVDKECRHWIGFFHKMNPNARIVVTGCYAEKDSDLLSFLPGISSVIKNSDKNRIADIISGTLPEGTAPRPVPFTSQLFITDFKNHTKAFIKIQDGCENRCSYCKVPLVRGALSSKPLSMIVDEVSGLAARGFKEIVLSGICLGAWGRDLFPAELAGGVGMSGAGLIDVLKALDKVKGDFRIRLSSIEPRYVTDELIDFIASNKKVCPHFHIPLQSGDDDILRRMNRPYTTDHYRRLIGNVRSKIKDAAITTDILVGFPGETDNNFRNTVNFVKEIMPSRSHIFTFSKRNGTPAFDMTPQIMTEIARRRYNELKAVACQSSYLYRKQFQGRTLNVLVETKREKFTRLLTGYSENYIKMLFEGPDDLMRKVVPVRVKDMTLLYTMGECEDILHTS